MIKNKPTYTLLQDRSDLHKISQELMNEKVIGVDLEADSLFHYKEKICMLQISTPVRNILVDPLATGDLSSLKPVFENTGIIKIFHGADYDMRSLYRDFKIEVRSLFDTQVASRFLGNKEIGLASLLIERFGVKVEKKYQKKDWSKRPLPDGMLSYAVQDTCHLIPLYHQLKKDLKAKGNLFIVEEECELLSKVRPAAPNSKPLFVKFKGSNRLDRRSLAVLEAMLNVREDLAFKKDRPPFKVLNNEPIMEISLKKPRTQKDLCTIKGISPRQVEAMGSSILVKISEAMNLPEDELPKYPKKISDTVTPYIAKRIKTLREWREVRAEKLGFDDPSLVCTNAQIKALSLAEPMELEQMEKIDGIRRWQKKLFGKDLYNLLHEPGTETA